MKTWMLPWLLPVGMLATVVILTLFEPYAWLAAVVVAALLLPVLWRTHFPSAGEDADTQYWRMRRL
jgi:hypothetical protein